MINVAVARICAWAGVVQIVTFLVAFVFIAKMVPPIPPSWTAAQVLAFYQANSFGIRVGTAIMMLAAAGGLAWSGGVAAWTARMEGSTLPALSFTQLICGAWAYGGVYLALVDFSSAAFRPDRPEQIVYAFNDHGWYWIVMVGSCAVMQCIFIGIAVLSDRSGEQIFPRWVGYFNIWMGILQIPGVMMALFKTGPFAWDGLFAFWVPLSVFSFWIYVNTWAMLRATRRHVALQAANADAA